MKRNSSKQFLKIFPVVFRRDEMSHALKNTVKFV